VHLAGQSSAARSFVDPDGTFAANVRGTWNLLEAVRSGAPHARVLVVGSSECYGPQPAGTRADEATRFAPVSPYALSKAVVDALAESCARGFGLDIVRARPFSHTGPGQTSRFAIPAFAEQIAAIEAGRSEPVLQVGNLDVVRDICDVRDVAIAYTTILERATTHSVFNVCSGQGVKLSEVVEGLIAGARVPIRVEVDPARMRPADVPWLVGDGEAIRRELGWRAEIPLRRTLDDILAEWRGR
jgi:GDP-4-dehydro-6-deoxy-D-mannose reductase